MNAPIPPDLPDDPVDVMPVFTTRRKAEALPPVRPAVASKELEPKAPRGVRVVALDGWQSGFRWGVVATVGGVCLMVALAVGMLK